SIYKKLLEVQKEVGAISKDSKNPFFKSKYFDINKLIEVVNPVLSDKGIVLLQPIQDNKVQSVLVDSESGDSVKSELELPNLTDPQKVGSCISYYRRYTLSSLLGLQAEDEDGNGLKSKPKPKQLPKITPEAYQKAIAAISENKVTLDQIKAKYSLSENQEKELKNL
ncbi:MAG: hypothetical protein GY822_30340, partial [Deltaproteobacteria bacterium]|nr:hypothetical protein [Deltaproteobacteria bacterium]